MAYDESLAERVRHALAGQSFSEKKMFGGLCFMCSGHMTVGVLTDRLMIRVGRDAYEASLALPHASPMDFTGTPLKTMVFVGHKGLESEDDLQTWVDRGLAFTGTLPPK